jgi:hypothetical protein
VARVVSTDSPKGSEETPRDTPLATNGTPASQGVMGEAKASPAPVMTPSVITPSISATVAPTASADGVEKSTSKVCSHFKIITLIHSESSLVRVYIFSSIYI